MENASKALIIAGAILLSILIISLGLMVYQNSKNTVGSANLSKQEVTTFNSEWESYVGQNKTASEVQTMISAVIASNASETKAGTGRMVKIKDSQPDKVPILSTSNTYTVTATYDKSSGLITALTYTQNSGTSSSNNTTT